MGRSNHGQTTEVKRKLPRPAATKSAFPCDAYVVAGAVAILSVVLALVLMLVPEAEIPREAPPQAPAHSATRRVHKYSSDLTTEDGNLKLSDTMKVLEEAKEGDTYIRVMEDKRNSFRMLVYGECVVGGVHLVPGHNLAAHSIFTSNPVMATTQYLPILKNHSGAKQADVLQIGLGVGSVSMDLWLWSGVASDVVERSPAVYDFAQKYFGYGLKNKDGEEAATRTFLTDAHDFIFSPEYEAEHRVYKVVVMDIFVGHTNGTLLTKEALSRVRSRMMTESSVLVLLVPAFYSEGEADSGSSRMIYGTLMSIFKHCRVFHDGSTGEPTNLMFFCSDDANSLKHDMPAQPEPEDKEKAETSNSRPDIMRKFTEWELPLGDWKKHDKILSQADPESLTLWKGWQDTIFQHYRMIVQLLFPDIFTLNAAAAAATAALAD